MTRTYRWETLMFRPMTYPFRAIMFSISALLAFASIACAAEPTQVPASVPQIEPTPVDTPDISATVIAAIVATVEARPTETTYPVRREA